MTPIATMVREMMARGVDADVITLAVETAELSASVCEHSADKTESADDRRRRLDRERKRTIRRNPQTSADIPRTAETAHIEDKKETIVKEKKKDMSRGQRLSADWQPTPQDWAMAGALHGEAAAKLELEKFRDHWKAASGKGSAKADWNAAWRNWIRNVRTWGPNANRTANPRASGHDAILAHASERARELNRVGEMAGADDPIPFSFGRKPDDGAAGGNSGAPVAAAGNHHGRESVREHPIEGEIIPPDEYAARVSGGR